ncbi:hypothetical protein ACQEVZ_60115 [Dactylosporangium sp. CA-152071]|uniref:hypothetical protein n=1 Tax=Dactylosporangium sp. CA-152071 TaxID=3239933 RepID=UPI003D8C5B08
MNLSLSDRREGGARPAGSLPRWVPGWSVAALTALLILTPVPAFAEGSWNSSLSGVRSGFTSRTWHDANNDGTITKTTLSGCSRDDGANFFLEVDLRRKRSFAPDVSYGRRNVSSCSGGTGTGSWGDQTSGDYFLQFWHYDFGTVSASSVGTVY